MSSGGRLLVHQKGTLGLTMESPGFKAGLFVSILPAPSGNFSTEPSQCRKRNGRVAKSVNPPAASMPSFKVIPLVHV